MLVFFILIYNKVVIVDDVGLSKEELSKIRELHNQQKEQKPQVVIQFSKGENFKQDDKKENNLEKNHTKQDLDHIKEDSDLKNNKNSEKNSDKPDIGYSKSKRSRKKYKDEEECQDSDSRNYTRWRDNKSQIKTSNRIDDDFQDSYDKKRGNSRFRDSESPKRRDIGFYKDPSFDRGREFNENDDEYRDSQKDYERDRSYNDSRNAHKRDNRRKRDTQGYRNRINDNKEPYRSIESDYDDVFDNHNHSDDFYNRQNHTRHHNNHSDHDHSSYRNENHNHDNREDFYNSQYPRSRKDHLNSSKYHNDVDYSHFQPHDSFHKPRRKKIHHIDSDSFSSDAHTPPMIVVDNDLEHRKYTKPLEKSKVLETAVIPATDYNPTPIPPTLQPLQCEIKHEIVVDPTLHETLSKPMNCILPMSYTPQDAAHDLLRQEKINILDANKARLQLINLKLEESKLREQTLITSIQDISSKISFIDIKLKDTSKENRDLDNNLVLLKNKKNNLIKNQNDLKISKDKIEAEFRLLQNSIAHLCKEIDDLKNKSSVKNEEVTVYNQQLIAQKNNLDSVMKDLEIHENKSMEYKKEVSSLESLVAQLKAQLNELSSKKSSEERLQNQLDMEKERIMRNELTFG